MAYHQYSFRRRELTPETEAWADELAERCGGVIPDQLDGLPDEFYAYRTASFRTLSCWRKTDTSLISVRLKKPPFPQRQKFLTERGCFSAPD